MRESVSGNRMRSRLTNRTETTRSKTADSRLLAFLSFFRSPSAPSRRSRQTRREIGCSAQFRTLGLSWVKASAATRVQAPPRELASLRKALPLAGERVETWQLVNG
jgi:hypothetical protein